MMNPEIKERLLNWCSKNFINLSINEDNEYSVEVPKFGTLLIIEPKEGKIIEKMYFLFSSDDWDKFDSLKPDYILFEFGTDWFYCKPKEVTDEYNDSRIKAEFNEFKYVGDAVLEIPMENFCNLGIHTEYEMLNGSGSTNLWAKKAKFLGCKSAAICDKNTLAATMSFQLDCQKYDIKSIMGETVSVAIDYDENKDVQLTYDLKLYVENNVGWLNLLQINKIINVTHGGSIPEELLFKHSMGLIAVIPKEGEFNYYINDKPKGLKWISKYKKAFKKLYYQIDSVEFYDDKSDLKNLNNIKEYIYHWKKLIAPVLINDSYYLDQDMFSVKEYLNKVAGRAEVYSEDQYFKTLDQTYNQFSVLFPDEKADMFFNLFTDMVSNTKVISDFCNFQIEIGKPRLPKYPYLEDGQTADEKMVEIVMEGFTERISGVVENIEDYEARVEKELDLIIMAGISDYFLILWDVINWCYENDVMVGVARGSAGGSLVCYLMKITNIDPIKYNLLFERFLNETRVTPLFWYDLTLQNGKMISLLKGTEIYLSSGKVVNVEDLKEDDDIDLSRINL